MPPDIRQLTIEKPTGVPPIDWGKLVVKHGRDPIIVHLYHVQDAQSRVVKVTQNGVEIPFEVVDNYFP